MKWALVTGGNRGLGLAVCRRIVAAGKPVVLTARDLLAGTRAAEELRGVKPGAQVEVLPLEAASGASIKMLAAAVAQQYPDAVDLLVVNAGVFERENKWTQGAYAKTMSVNFTGALDTALALAPAMAPGGLVVVVSSSLGQRRRLSPDYADPIAAATNLEELRTAAGRFDAASGMPQHNSYSPDYSVSKAAINRAVQLLAAEGSPLRPRVAIASVCPGWCRTDMGTDAADRSPDEGAALILAPWEAHAAGRDVNGTFTRGDEALDW